MSKLDVEFDKDEDKKIEELKNQYGIKQTTELIRFLITFQYNLRNMPATSVIQLLTTAQQVTSASAKQQ